MTIPPDETSRGKVPTKVSPDYDSDHQAFADAFAASYDRVESQLGTRIFCRHENTIVRSVLRNIVGENEILGRETGVIDVGAGTGRFESLVSAEFPGVRVTATDFSFRMLEEAHSRGFPDSVELQMAPAERLPFADNSYDIVLHGFGVASYTTQRLSFPEAYRVLRPGGVAVFTAYNRDGLNHTASSLGLTPAVPARLDVAHDVLWIGDGSVRCRTFSREQLRAVLESLGFEVINATTFLVLSATLPQAALVAVAESKAGPAAAERDIEQTIYDIEVALSRHPITQSLGMYLTAVARKPVGRSS